MDNRNYLLELSERPPGKRLGLGRLEVSVSHGGDRLSNLSARLPYQKRKTPKKLSRNTGCATKFFATSEYRTVSSRNLALWVQ